MSEQPIEEVSAEPEPLATGSPLEQDVIAKINAGANLVNALFRHPKAYELFTSDFMSKGLTDAYMAACTAYGIGRHSRSVSVEFIAPLLDEEAVNELVLKAIEQLKREGRV